MPKTKIITIQIIPEPSSTLLTPFEEKRVSDLAIDMFDLDVTAEALTERMEALAKILDCSVAQLVACYVRPSLSVFEHTPRNIGMFDDLSFDLDYARSCARKSARESARSKINE